MLRTADVQLLLAMLTDGSTLQVIVTSAASTLLLTLALQRLADWREARACDVSISYLRSYNRWRHALARVRASRVRAARAGVPDERGTSSEADDWTVPRTRSSPACLSRAPIVPESPVNAGLTRRIAASPKAQAPVPARVFISPGDQIREFLAFETARHMKADGCYELRRDSSEWLAKYRSWAAVRAIEPSRNGCS